MTNYEKAKVLLDRGVARRHYTFNTTRTITLDLGGKYWATIAPDEKTVEVICGSQVRCRGNISDDLAKVFGTRNNSRFFIKAWG